MSTPEGFIVTLVVETNVYGVKGHKAQCLACPWQEPAKNAESAGKKAKAHGAKHKKELDELS